MKRPTRTIRVDELTHADLRRMAERFGRRWRRHVSLADLVRMGLALLERDIGQRESNPPEVRRGE